MKLGKSPCGDNWSKIMAQRSFDSYDKKHPGNEGGPFASKEIRKKCEETWGGVSSPACNKDTQEKISESIHKLWSENDEYSESYRNTFYEKTLVKYQQINPNILDYDGENFTYKCPVCGKITYFDLQFLRKRLKYNLDLCVNCEPKHGVSNLEKNLLNYIKEIYPGQIIENDKTIISPKELDIVLPELKLAFEFDGVYWHMDDRIYESTDFNKKKNMTAKEIWDYDNQKIKLCEVVGYKLIRIKELDWVNDSINIKNFIKKLINEVKV